MKNSLKVYADGGARSNPGPAAIGFVVLAHGKEIFSHGQFIGKATNNEAEYKGVLAALLWLEKNYAPIKKEFSFEEIEFFLDSQLIVNQLNGLYKIKNNRLRSLILKVRNQEGVLYSKKITQKIIYNHIPREQNERADNLLNNALNTYLSLNS